MFTDSFVDASVNIDIHYPFDQEATAAPVRVSGEIGFWDEPASGRWEANGEVHLRLFQFIDAEAAGLVNNEGIAGCIGVDGFGIAGHYRFSDHHVEGGAYAFHSCNDELSRYHNHPLVSHCGPFTPGGCISAASPNDAVILPGGTGGQELRITSSATPVVKVTSPDGRITFTTPSQPGQRVDQRGSYLATLAPDTHQLLILLVHPQAGRWRVDPVGGTPADRLRGSGRRDAPAGDQSARATQAGLDVGRSPTESPTSSPARRSASSNAAGTRRTCSAPYTPPAGTSASRPATRSAAPAGSRPTCRPPMALPRRR